MLVVPALGRQRQAETDPWDLMSSKPRLLVKLQAKAEQYQSDGHGRGTKAEIVP